MKKEITLLIGSLAGGGAEGVCVTLANGFIKKDYKVNLIVLNLKNAVNKSRLDDSVNLIDLNVSNVRFSFKSLRDYMKNNKPEEVLVFDHLLSVMLILVRYSLSHKYKIIARNINTLSKELASYNSFWYKNIVKPSVMFFYKKVDYIINQSEGMMNDLLNLYPEFEGRTTYIYNPVNDKISAISEIIKDSKRNYFLCIGRLEQQKSFHIAIEAFSKIVKDYPNYRLKIIGVGSLDDSLKELAFKLNVSDKVDFLGFRTDVIQFYQNAKATLLTSKYEGFPNVLVESVSLGTPIISFDCPCGPSEIINNENGFLVEYNNLNEFVHCLDKMCTKDFDYEKIMELAQIYNINIIVDKYNSIIENVKS